MSVCLPTGTRGYLPCKLFLVELWEPKNLGTTFGVKELELDTSDNLVVADGKDLHILLSVLATRTGTRQVNRSTCQFS